MSLQFPYADATAIVAAAIDTRLNMMQPGKAPFVHGVLWTFTATFDADPGNVWLYMGPSPNNALHRQVLVELQQCVAGVFSFRIPDFHAIPFQCNLETEEGVGTPARGDSNLWLVAPATGAATTYTWIASVEKVGR